jgi:hypothetical protein
MGPHLRITKNAQTGLPANPRSDGPLRAANDAARWRAAPKRVVRRDQTAIPANVHDTGERARCERIGGWGTGHRVQATVTRHFFAPIPVAGPGAIAPARHRTHATHRKRRQVGKGVVRSTAKYAIALPFSALRLSALSAHLGFQRARACAECVREVQASRPEGPCPAGARRAVRSGPGESSNGRTADSDSACLGSNPSSPTNKINDLSLFRCALKNSTPHQSLTRMCRREVLTFRRPRDGVSCWVLGRP